MSYLALDEEAAELDPIETMGAVQRVLSDLLGCDASCIRPHTTIPDLFKPFDSVLVSSICAALEDDLDFYIDEDSIMPFFKRPTSTAGDLAKALQKLSEQDEDSGYYDER